MEEVPRRTSLAPLASLSCVLYFIGVETEGFLDYQGRAGIISIVRWNLRPVIFGVEPGTVPNGFRQMPFSLAQLCVGPKLLKRCPTYVPREHA